IRWGNGTLASTSVSYIVCVLPATNNLFAPEMAKNSPSETRTSRMAYCSKSLLPSNTNWTNRFISMFCLSIESKRRDDALCHTESHPGRALTVGEVRLSLSDLDNIA